MGLKNSTNETSEDSESLRLKIDRDLAHVFQNKNVHIADEERLKKLLAHFRIGSKENLQVIFDFDRTLSAVKTPDGSEAFTSHRTLFSYKNDVFHLQDRDDEMRQENEEIEFSNTISIEEKIPLMIQWWERGNGFIINAGLAYEDIREAANTAKLVLRDGAVALVQKLRSSHVPIMVASAGLGDIVKVKLEKELDSLAGIELVSNFGVYNEEHVITGFSKPTIHSFNKYVIAEIGAEYFKTNKRPNVVVFGDSVGDVDMVKRLPFEATTLKVGFINSDSPESVDEYLQFYDIVLQDPRTLWPLMPMFDFLLAVKSDASGGSSA